jgi:hypothetical protein
MVRITISEQSAPWSGIKEGGARIKWTTTYNILHGFEYGGLEYSGLENGGHKTMRKIIERK